MANKPPLAHPLKWPQFYTACIRYAATGAWAVVGFVSTVASLIPGVVKWAYPAGHAVAALWLKGYGFGDDLLWKAPLWIGSAILLARLLTAPFVIYRDKPGLDSAMLPSHELAFEQLRDEDARLRKEVETRPPPRHLSQEHSNVITKAMSDVLAEQSKLWPADAPTERLIVAVCTIGMSEDTINYAGAIADALESAGYRASRQTFMDWKPQCAYFKRGVTVIDDLRHPDNPYHKALMLALREVGIAVKSAQYAPPPSAGLAVDTGDLYRAAVTLTVGQRERSGE